MTAKPLFEIMRGLYMTLIEQYPPLFIDDKETIKSILKFCATEHERLANRRNDLLHGTWHIGWGHPDQQDFSELLVHKAKVTAGGVTFVDGLPKTAQELSALTQRCDHLMRLLDRLSGMVIIGLLQNKATRVRFEFRKDNDRWLPEPPPAEQSA